MHGTHLALLDDPHIYGEKEFWPNQPASGLLQGEQIVGVLIKVRQGIPISLEQLNFGKEISMTASYGSKGNCRR